MAIVEALLFATSTAETTDLNVRQLTTLLLVQRASGDDATVGELMRMLEIPKPSVTRATTRLVHLKLIERFRNREDGRVVYFRMTEKGTKLISKVKRLSEAG